MQRLSERNKVKKNGDVERWGNQSFDDLLPNVYLLN